MNDKRSIPRKWVKDVGADAAYMLSILCELQLNEAEYPEDKPEWFFLTTDELAQRFPLLKKTAIRDILIKLKGKNKRMLLVKSGLKVAGKTLGYSVPAFVMKQWQCQEDRIRFNTMDSIRCRCIARALVMEIVCRNKADKIKPNRHAIFRETGIPVSTVHDIINEFKGKLSDAMYQSLQDRQLVPDETGKFKPVKEIGNGYRIKDAQGNVTYTRDLETAELALSS